MEHFQNTLGIVIKTKTVKESDILVTLLTPQLGKITALAKGAKNIKSSRLGSLQLGNIIKANLYKKNDFLWLSESTTLSQFLHTKKNLTQLNLLFYILEILNLVIAENQQLPDVYETSEKIITAINHNHLAEFIKYEIKLINILGFGLPEEINKSFKQKNYINSQKLIKRHLESIIEKPLESNKLFK
jgi:DNA repair protein RecO (recombination protein O)